MNIIKESKHGKGTFERVIESRKININIMASVLLDTL